jgi:uncharacterized protein (DUF433 family)
MGNLLIAIGLQVIYVADVFGYLGGGMIVAEVLDDFPDLTAEHIQA